MKQKFVSILMVTISILLALLLVFIIFFNNTFNSPISRTTLIKKEKAPTNWEFELLYSDINLSSTSKVTYSSDSIKINTDILSPYASGFLETSYLNNLLEIINSHRSLTGLSPIYSIFSHHKFDNSTIVSTSSGLDTLYIIDETTNSIFSPFLVSDSCFLPQYVYDIIEDRDNYYILTAGVNNLAARLFCLSKESLILSEVWHLTTDDTALSDMQYTLLNSSTALFTNSNGVEISNGTIIPLDFSPEFLFNNNKNTVGVKIKNDQILVALIDNSTLSLVKTTSFVALSPNLSIVDGMVDSNYLYLFTYDPHHPNYRYYLNIYNLDTNELILCEALSDYNNLRILNITTPPLNSIK